MKIIIDWINDNQGVVAIFIFIATILTAWITGLIKFLWNLIFKKAKLKKEFKIDFTFNNNKKEITYKPKFYKIITEYTIKLQHEDIQAKKDRELKENLIQSIKVKQDLERLASSFSNGKYKTFYSQRNYSRVEIKFRLKNIGKTTLENYKIYIMVENKIKDLKVGDNQIENYQYSAKIDSWRKILLEPIKSILVPNDIVDFDTILLWPVSVDCNVIFKWTLLSREFNTNGELILISKPEIIEKIETKYVETEAELKSPESKIEEYLV